MRYRKIYTHRNENQNTDPEPDGLMLAIDYMSDEECDELREQDEEFDAECLAHDIREGWKI